MLKEIHWEKREHQISYPEFHEWCERKKRDSYSDVKIERNLQLQ